MKVIKLAMKFLSISALASCALVLVAGTPVVGQLTPYSQGFDTLTAPGPGDSNSDLDLDGWDVFGSVFEANGDFAYQFDQTFPAPNVGEGPAFSGIATGEPTTSGSNYLNIFSDYNNADHTNGSNRTINSFVFREDTVGADDVGDTWTLAYDFRTAIGPFGVADSNGQTTTAAYVTVLDSLGGTFDQLGLTETDTSAATTTFTAGSASLLIDIAHVGQTIQYGFLNRASNENPSGVYYDSLSFNVDGAAVLGDFNDDGNVDNLDIDAYTGNLNVAATGNLAQLDLNDDGQVTLADHEQHVTTLVTAGGIAGTALGDANLDGTVDVLGDAAALVNNLGLSPRGWAEGDFNADGLIDVLGDAAILVNNLGASNGGGSAAVATSAVPEPGTVSLLGLAVTALAVRRRR